MCRTVAAGRGPTDRLRTPRCDRELCLRPRHTVTSEMAARGCAELGLTPELSLREAFGFAVLRQTSACPDRYPRRTGIPAKRPLFS